MSNGDLAMGLSSVMTNIEIMDEVIRQKFSEWMEWYMVNVLINGMVLREFPNDYNQATYIYNEKFIIYNQVLQHLKSIVAFSHGEKGLTLDVHINYECIQNADGANRCP